MLFGDDLLRVIVQFSYLTIFDIVVVGFGLGLHPAVDVMVDYLFGWSDAEIDEDMLEGRTHMKLKYNDDILIEIATQQLYTG